MNIRTPNPALKPTPTPHHTPMATPAPQPAPTDIFSLVFGSGLTSVLLILVILLLLCIIGAIIWMFMTGRWTAAPPPTYSARSGSSPVTPGVEDPLSNKRWLGLVRGCVDLFDELDGLFPDADPRQEAANHVKYRLQEILGRSGVEIISHDRTFDVYRHQLVPPNSEAPVGTPITKFVSPGFAVGRLVLRPAEVQVIKTPMQNVE